MKYNKIVFSFKTLLSPNLKGFKDMQICFPNSKKKHWYGLKFCSSEKNHILRTKAREKETENEGEMLFCQNFNRDRPVM